MEEEKVTPEKTAEKEAPAEEKQQEKPEAAEKKKKKSSDKSEEIEKLKKEIEQNNDKYLRLLAEYDNFRKRTVAEKTGIYNNAVSDTVQAILPIADNIGLALRQENASAEDMKKGVEMIETQIEAVFEKLNIKPVGEVGETFDPALHNAVAHIDDENLGENVISAVFQKGYMLGDRVVRHAMVQVAN